MPLRLCSYVNAYRLGPTSGNAGETARISDKNCHTYRETRTGAMLHGVECRKRRSGIVRETNTLTRRDSILLSRQTWNRSLRRAEAENAAKDEGGMTSDVPWLVDVHSSTICRIFIPLDPKRLASQYKPLRGAMEAAHWSFARHNRLLIRIRDPLVPVLQISLVAELEDMVGCTCVYYHG